MSIFAAVPFIPRKITHRGGCSYTSAALTFGRPRPNALGKTIWIRHGSRFRLGEKAGTVASALVLRRDAQKVGKDRRRRKCRCVCPGWCGAASPWKPPSAANDLSHCVTFNWEKCAPRRASVVHSE